MFTRAAILFCAALLADLPANAATLDRIAVTIGRHVIAESEIVAEMRVTAFIDMAAADLSAATKRTAAARLVDQYLILEDAAISRALVSARDSEAAALMAPIRARYGSNLEYRAALDQAQVSEAELTQHFLNGLKLLRYTETRFHPEVDVSEADLRAAYDKLVKEARNRLGAEPTASSNPLVSPLTHDDEFEKSKDQLQQLIFAERLNQAMDRWLEAARAGANIQYRESVFQ